MPGVYRPRTAYTAFPAMLAASVQRLRAVEMQQQETLSNSSGLPVVNWGTIIYGNGNTTYGIQFLDGTGVQRMLIGLQTASDTYGVSFSDPSGNSQELLPLAAGYANGPITSAATSPVIVAGTPEVTAYIGPSGDALVTVSCFMAALGSNPFGNIFIAIDGVIAPTRSMSINGDGMTAYATVQISKVSYIGTVTPNEDHVFTIAMGNDVTSNSLQVTNLSIVVQPI